MNGYKNGHKPNGSYEDTKMTADYLLAHTKHRPVIGIICGSGLGGLVDMLTDTESFDYHDIPHFAVSTAPGHKGRLVFGMLGDKCCVCMQGRVHMYEGYPIWKLVFPVRVMKLMGCGVLIATNAAGGINTKYKVGDLMIFKDHINLPGLCGLNPLLGPNDDRFGPRFPAMSEAYDKKLRSLAKEVSKELGYEEFLHEGVYIVQSGPCFESVTECKLMKALEADVTGMSTVPEVVAAHHCGMKVFAMSLVTNMCVSEYDSEEKADAEEVLVVGKQRSNDMQQLIAKMVEKINV